MGAMARLAMCGVVGGAAALGVFALAAPTASQSALLQVLSPQVTVSRDRGSEDVTTDLVIRSGDTVRTDETGRALVTYPDGSTAALDGSTELTIEFVRTSAGDYLVRMEQTIGRVWYAAARTIGSGGRYEVHSAAMASVIRAGSGFYVAVSEDGATSITATSGAVDATAGGVTVTVPAGTATTISGPGQTPAPPALVAAPQSPTPAPGTTDGSPTAVIAPSPAGAEDGPQTSAPKPAAPVAVQVSAPAPKTETSRGSNGGTAAPVTLPYVPTTLLKPDVPDKDTTADKVGEQDKSATATTSKETSTTTRSGDDGASRTKESASPSREPGAHESSEKSKERGKGDGR